MDGLARGIRLIAGLGMVASGTALAAPAAMELAAWWRVMSEVRSPVAAPSIAPAATQSAPSHAVFPQPAVNPAVAAAGAGGPVELNRDYVLPQPPAPLPPVPAPPTPADTGLARAYRSTLEVPPPPLLDGQQPPPLAVGWVGGEAERSGMRAAPTPPTPAAVYVIRDGDDLNGIATRFYGHPAAAAVIWQANRGQLRDPGVLPIGLTILLPHPDTVAAVTQPGPRSPTIEPSGEPANVRTIGQTWP